MNSNELLDAVKTSYGLPSDYALARQLGVEPQAIQSMRRKGLSDARAVQIATLLGLNQGEVLAAVHAERAKDPEVRKAWEKLVKTVRSAAAGLLVLLGIATGAPEPAQAAFHFTSYTLCALRRLRRSCAILGVLAAFFSLTSAPVAADDNFSQFSLAVHLASRHLEQTTTEYNEANLGLGGRWQDGLGYWLAGAYRNSIRRASVYGGGGRDLLTAGPVRIGVSVGLVTGYRNVPVAPFLTPEASLDLGRGARLVLTYTPTITYRDTHFAGAVAASILVPFGR